MTTRNRIAVAVLAGALLVSGAGHVQAQNKPDCPKGAAEIDGQNVKETVSHGGAPASVTLNESCVPNEHYEVIAEVSSVGDRHSSADYRISRSGTF